MNVPLGRSLRLRASLPALSLAAALLAGCGGDEQTKTPPPPESRHGRRHHGDAARSRARSSATDCAEPDEPFDCPTITPWDKLPHAAACGTWDGTYPGARGRQVHGERADRRGGARRRARIRGRRRAAGRPPHRARGPRGRLRRAGPRRRLPDEHLAVPGTPLRARLGRRHQRQRPPRRSTSTRSPRAGRPSRATSPSRGPTSLFYGLAWLPPDRALASGGGDGKVYAFDVDTGDGHADARRDARHRSRPGRRQRRGTPGAIAVTRRRHAARRRALAMTPRRSTSSRSPTPTTARRSRRSRSRARTRSSTSGSIRSIRRAHTFYATDQIASRASSRSTPPQATVTRTIALEKNPSQIAFLDATYLVVAEARQRRASRRQSRHGRRSRRASRSSRRTRRTASRRARSPTTPRRSASTRRSPASTRSRPTTSRRARPPTITPAGRIPTGWWPTGVHGRRRTARSWSSTARGTAPAPTASSTRGARAPITDRCAAASSTCPRPILADLDRVDRGRRDRRASSASSPGARRSPVPRGADDFPIPADNTSGPSKQIKHVILVVRENKTYDAVFGDRADLGDGDPVAHHGERRRACRARSGRTRAPSPRTFTNFDNFYTDAEQSIQGHIWTSYGRTTDYMERTWLDDLGPRARARRPTPTQRSSRRPRRAASSPGSTTNGIDVRQHGRDHRRAPTGSTANYPGLVYAQNLPDVDKSCYIGGRIRLALRSQALHVRAPDRTITPTAARRGAAAPEVMIAVNDEASACSSTRSRTARSGRTRSSSSPRTIRRTAAITSICTARSCSWPRPGSAAAT